MSKKQQQPVGDQLAKIEFEKINDAINVLLKKLREVCPCCLARGLIYRGSHLLADVAGGEEVVEVCHDIIYAIEQPDDVCENQTQH